MLCVVYTLYKRCKPNALYNTTLRMILDVYQVQELEEKSNDKEVNIPVCSCCSIDMKATLLFLLTVITILQFTSVVSCEFFL